MRPVGILLDARPVDLLKDRAIVSCKGRPLTNAHFFFYIPSSKSHHIAKAVELFMQSLVEAAVLEAERRGSRKVQAYHLWVPIFFLFFINVFSLFANELPCAFCYNYPTLSTNDISP
jgi:hypothetical protein